MFKILYFNMFLMAWPFESIVTTTYSQDKASLNISPIADCKLKIEAEVKNAMAGTANGEIKLTISGGMSPYQVFWIGNVPSKRTNNQKIDGLSNGYYSVVVVDNNRCSETLMNIKVDLNPVK
jgi:hypothetical protein